MAALATSTHMSFSLAHTTINWMPSTSPTHAIVTSTTDALGAPSSDPKEFNHDKSPTTSTSINNATTSQLSLTSSFIVNTTTPLVPYMTTTTSVVRPVLSSLHMPTYTPTPIIVKPDHLAILTCFHLLELTGKNISGGVVHGVQVKHKTAPLPAGASSLISAPSRTTTTQSSRSAFGAYSRNIRGPNIGSTPTSDPPYILKRPSLTMGI